MKKIVFTLMYDKAANDLHDGLLYDDEMEAIRQAESAWQTFAKSVYFKNKLSLTVGSAFVPEDVIETNTWKDYIEKKGFCLCWEAVGETSIMYQFDGDHKISNIETNNLLFDIFANECFTANNPKWLSSFEIGNYYDQFNELSEDNQEELAFFAGYRKPEKKNMIPNGEELLKRFKDGWVQHYTDLDDLGRIAYIESGKGKPEDAPDGFDFAELGRKHLKKIESGKTPYEILDSKSGIWFTRKEWIWL